MQPVAHSCLWAHIVATYRTVALSGASSERDRRATPSRARIVGLSDRSMRALLPVITTRRPERRDRAYLAWVAVAGEIAHLPLETAPIDASMHVLEIYVE